MNFFWAVLLQIVLIFLNAVFSGAEIAVISMNEAKLNALASRGGKNAQKAQRLTKLTKDPARFLSTIQVAITLAGFLGSAFAAEMFAEPIVEAIVAAGATVPYEVLSAIFVVLITVVLAFFNIVFGELVPKRIAMNHSEGVATKLSGLLAFVSVIFKPIVWLLSVCTNGVLRLFGINPADRGEPVTEEDILLMAEAGTENGSIEREENAFIKNVFEFSDTTIGELCTHRTEVDVLFERETEEEWEQVIYSTNHTYYPICGETVDDVVGVLFTKAFFRLKERSRESVMQRAVQAPVRLYESASALDVFNQMKKTREYFAVVIDEYGGTAGIITIHDLLEALVGDMDDKGDEAEYSIEKLEDNLWEIKGLAPFEEVQSALGVTIEKENEAEHETFSGFIGSILVSVPEDGATFSLETEQLKIEVLTVEEQHIEKVRVSLKTPPILEED